MIFKITDPSIQANMMLEKGSQLTHRLPDGFLNKRVIFMAKFTTVVIACNIITIDESNTKAFTFTPESFVFTTIELPPPKDTCECISSVSLKETNLNFYTSFC